MNWKRSRICGPRNECWRGNNEAEQVVEALLRESAFAFKEKGNYLRGLCPQCGKPELLVRKSMPWQVMCSREVNCGYRESVRNLLPDLFSDFARRYPPTEKEPFATADAF